MKNELRLPLDGTVKFGARSLAQDPPAAAPSFPEINGRWVPRSTSRFNVLHEIFEAQVDARPDAVAVVFGRVEITYGELDQRANRLARHLRRRRVRRGSVVALLIRKSVDAYAALLGILKAGAAYLPLDPEYPSERVAYILENSGAGVLVTTDDLAPLYAGFGGMVIRLESDAAEIEAECPTRLPSSAVGAGPRDLCYVIYTSGSTGRPKGVLIEHRSACHLVCAEGRIFALRPDDRVYQGFSLAFDASVEEVWLAFAAGATLVAATPEMSHAGPDLAKLLTELGVTVLSCVPTLLAMIDDDLPTIRLLILGGEACPERLAKRWATPRRRVVNTYGPTETTVIATYADLIPGKSVTLGRAVPGYHVYVLDDGLRPVQSGEPGEIWIGGIGVARGYVGMPGHTGARFLPDPFACRVQAEARIYRTGDLGRFDAAGNLEFLGRADSQVKLRGYRVELTEIESALMQFDGVRAAACALRETTPGAPQLVGYVVSRNGAINEARLREHLRHRLPAFMVPAVIESLADLPQLPSGKLDRSALPAPQNRCGTAKAHRRGPRTETEQRIAAICGALFQPQRVSVDDDFFLDLGGHSLLAARLVSELRKDSRWARVSVKDVYEHPTITALAATLEMRMSASATAPATPRTPQPHAATASAGDAARHFLCGLLQFFSLYGVFGFKAIQWMTPYLVYFGLLASELPVLESAAWAAMSAIIVFPLLVVVTVTAKWLLLGRVRAGRYRLWGWYYVRWWFVQTLVDALHLNHLAGTPWLPFVFRLFGSRIGKDVHIGTENLAAFDLISIGDGSCVDDQAVLLGYTVEGGELIIGPVTVGSGCFVGTRSTLREGAVMENGARLEDLSLLPVGARISRGQTWAGSPARCLPGATADVRCRPERGGVQRAVVAALYALLVLTLPLVPLCAYAPGVWVLTQLDPLARPLLYLSLVPLVGGSFVLLLTLEVVALKWLLVGRVRPGTYPVHGWFYVKNWMVDRLLMLSLDVVAPLHATLYLTPWYRALGAKLGRFVELSTASSTTPDLLEIADGGTVADEVSLGAARIEGGWMTVAATRIGRRAFVGNSAVVPAGTNLGDGSLVGVLSVPPSPHESARPDAAWLGSPPLRLPRRQTSAGFIEERTYCPSRKLVATRAVIELLRITLPPAGFIMTTAAVVITALALWEYAGLGLTAAGLPLVYAGCCAAVLAAVALAKWIVIGSYRPFERPLWSATVWRLELVNALYEFLATPLGLEALQGTPFLSWYLRLLGARIGRRAYLHTTGFLEWDLVEVGDRVALNDDCVLQTHLFEDRVLKVSRLRIGADGVVGAGSVVLYDSEVENGARLDALSLLMKGERLPAGTAWAGLPAAWQTATRTPTGAGVV